MSSHGSDPKWNGGSPRRSRGRHNASRTSSPIQREEAKRSHHNVQEIDSKPREETHFQTFYPDLDEERPLKVFITEHQVRGKDPFPKHAAGPLQKPVFKKISGDAFSLIPQKVSDGLKSLGYTDIEMRCQTQTRKTYVRPDNSLFALTTNTLTKEDPFQVLYDLDEQDAAFVKLMNQISSVGLSIELLEVLFTYLEREWYHLEKILPPKKKNLDVMSSDEMISKASQHTAIYGSDDGTGGLPEEDQCCAICNESECDNSNAIVFCDGCDIAVHQECYGVVFIPEGQWLCRSCLISRNNKAQCLFCPSKTGAFKQLENGSWCHVICALWISELYFASPIYLEPVEGLDLIPKSRWRLNCYICRQKVGACIQCSNRNCFQLYHVTCARRAQLYMKSKQGVQLAIANPNSLVSFCDKHSPASYRQHHDIRTGIEKTRLYFATVGAINDRNSNKKFSSSGKNSTSRNLENPFRWKSHLDTPILPQIFAVNLEKFLLEHDFSLSRDMVYQLCSYWSLKREFKRGAALIKRLDAAQYGTLTTEEIEERKNFLSLLTTDVEKLHELSLKTLERSRISDQRLDVILQNSQILHFPVNYIINDVYELVRAKLDQNGHLSSYRSSDNPENKTFEDLKAKNENFEYFNVQDFVDDFRQLMTTIATERAVNTAVLRRLYGRWTKDLNIIFKRAVAFEKQLKDLIEERGFSEFSQLLAEDGLKLPMSDSEPEEWQGNAISGELTDVEDESD